MFFGDIFILQPLDIKFLNIYHLHLRTLSLCLVSHLSHHLRNVAPLSWACIENKYLPCLHFRSCFRLQKYFFCGNLPRIVEGKLINMVKDYCF